MEINWLSFLLGGIVFLLGFLAIMAWLIPDKAAAASMTWITARRNFSQIGLALGLIAIVVFIVMVVIAVIKLLHYVQMSPWVWWVAGVGLGVTLVSVIMLLLARRKNAS